MPELMFQNKEILHYPQLDTVLMVEGFIRENSGEFKKKSLWENLPKQMMYQTFCVIIDYLMDSGKIAVDKEGKNMLGMGSEGGKEIFSEERSFMEINSHIKFGDEKTKSAFLDLENGKFHDTQLKKWLERAFGDLESNAFCGIQIPKRLIPKEYVVKFGDLDNLWKYNLPNAWRLIYTVKKDEIVVLSIVLEWMNHKEYEKRFGY